MGVTDGIRARSYNHRPRPKSYVLYSGLGMSQVMICYKVYHWVQCVPDVLVDLTDWLLCVWNTTIK